MESWLNRIVRISERCVRSFRCFEQEVSRHRVRLFAARLSGQIVSRRYICQVSAVSLLPTVHALLDSKKKTTMASYGDFSDIIKHADELYRQNAVDELYEYMRQAVGAATPTDADIAWRLARATCDKAKSTADKNARKELMYDAFRAAEHALKIGDSNYACHKWYAIMLDYVGEYEGTKERIAKAFKIKEHFLRAIQLNPRDATSVHLLGYWCFVFADMPWYQKKVASVVFATPPSSSYQEALEHFLEAEKVDPGFYSTNFLMIGKTYLRTKENELAKQYLIKARDYPVQTEDDKKAHKEAVELLQSLGVK